MMTLEELDKQIATKIQGVFGILEMGVLKEEIEKLKPGQVYLEIGVDEGRSFTVARYYADDEVWTIGIDYIDPPARAPYMNIKLGHFPNGEGLIALGKRSAYIHTDAKMFCDIWNKPIDLLFIDGDHSYEGVQKDYLLWALHVRPGGTILFHDYDHPDVKRFIDDTFKLDNSKEIIGNKIVRVRR